MFNYAGDGIVLTHQTEHQIRIMDYPELTVVHNTPAHVQGCVAAALDPRGRYVPAYHGRFWQTIDGMC